MKEHADHPDPRTLLSGAFDPLDVLRRCGRTFHAASRMLPPRVRRELALLYTFCRLVDDCGDEPGSGAGERAIAHELLDEIERNLSGDATTSPIVTQFRALAERRGVPRIHAAQLIEGVRSDLTDVRMRTQGELVRYAYRVASTVGLMMCRVLAVPRVGDRFAIDLGIAMQLTNIARDVREDAGNGRVYLPATWVDHDIVLAASPDDERTALISTAVERLLALADRYYDSAEHGMRYLPLAVRPGIRAAAVNYRAIGAVIRRDPHHAVHHRVSTTTAGKALRSCVAAFDAAADCLAFGREGHDERLHAPLLALRQPHS